ncbi:MAG: nucleotide-binding protein [Gammaproteobacteria bacterium]|nr:nucleotide-binding protein [Gammaproteobacteria bacterium]
MKIYTRNHTMNANLSGTWTGELSGTNSGGMMLQIAHESNRIYGSGRFYEPSLGSYEYDIQGVSKNGGYTFFLTPRQSQDIRLGTIQAQCRLSENDELNGTWNSSIGTAGTFTARRPEVSLKENKPVANSVFLVHGHDEATKEKIARFLEKIGLEVIILHEKVSQGMTIIEKFEEYAAQAGFAIVLFTPDDIGFPLGAEDRKRPRARQNVVLEMGVTGNWPALFLLNRVARINPSAVDCRRSVVSTGGA